MDENLHKEQDQYFAEWISGKITDDELKKLISDDTFIELKKIKKSLDVISYLNAPLDGTFEKIKDKIRVRESEKPKTIQLYTKWAASIAAVIILVLSISQFLSNQQVSINTGFGEQKTITLLDGSEVILNAKSELSYSKSQWKKSRKVNLTGEAFFKVTKGSKFTVVTKNGDVSVLGTQFNVKSSTNYFIVICYEGSVKVDNHKITHILKPGDAVSSIDDKDTTWKITATNPQWLSGISSFKETPLKIVIKELENQYKIQFNTNHINTDILFTGSFSNTNLNLALASVFKPMNIKYSKLNTLYTLNNNKE